MHTRTPISAQGRAVTVPSGRGRTSGGGEAALCAVQAWVSAFIYLSIYLSTSGSHGPRRDITVEDVVVRGLAVPGEG